MIRPFTFVAMLLAAIAGLYLYQAKQQARVLDRQISDLRAETEATHQRAEVLRAEYTLLNDPTRLAELVSAHLPDLRPTQPAQWTSLAELERRLPPVGEATAAPAPLEPAVPDPTPPAAAAPIAAAPTPSPTPRHPPPVVAHAPAPHPIVALARDPAATPAPVRPTARVAAPLPPPNRAAARAVTPTTPVLVSLHPAPRPVVADNAPLLAQVPVVASALGMARSMLAPVAVTPANAATLPSAQSGAGR
ncbi:MAG: hypothetical protein M0Z28_31370 [Rhodospirillales bacterium]|nr:hypothetical protein [Rhodospirillales bacterium]